MCDLEGLVTKGGKGSSSTPSGGSLPLPHNAAVGHPRPSPFLLTTTTFFSATGQRRVAAPVAGGAMSRIQRRRPPSADEMAARLDRAARERMFFMGRVASRGGGDDCGGDGGVSGVLAPFVVTGLSGSVYTIHLSTVEAGPSAADAGGVGVVAKCNCPDHIFRRVRLLPGAETTVWQT